MNILVLTSAYPQPDDGNEIVTPTVQYLSRKWAEMGHRVIVIHSNSCFPTIYYCIPTRLRNKLASKFGHSFPSARSRNTICRDDCGVEVYRFPIFKIIPYGKFSNRALDVQANKILQTVRDVSFTPDIIINHWVNPQVELVRRIKDQYRVRTSLVFHNDCNTKNIERFALIDATKLFDAIGCRSDSYARYVQKCLSLPKKPFICYSGIPDEQAYSQEKFLLSNQSLSQNKEFLYVGRLVEYKKVDAVINALANAYPKKDFVLHIVGMGCQKERLEKLANGRGVSENVIFHGQVCRQKVFELMSKCFCFTMVSKNETFGMVYIEAMLAGCVTIASEGGGVDGIIINGENGFLSPEGDESALTELYKKIGSLTDKELDILRRNAISSALKFKDSSLAKKYLDDVLSW